MEAVLFNSQVIVGKCSSIAQGWYRERELDKLSCSEEACSYQHLIHDS